MKLRYLILLAGAVVILAVGRPVQPVLAQSANETVPFKDVDLWVNPEYDDPRLLVMLEGNLDGVSAPIRVRFLVPTAAEMYSAGSLTARGAQGYSGGPPDRVASDIPGWDEISYTLTTDTFRVEYYDPVIPGQPDKKISYDFRTISPISNLHVTIQEPRQASNFAVTPQGTAGRDGDGFNINSSFHNNITGDGEPLHFDISYTRTATTPSLSSSGGRSGPTTLGYVMLGILAAAVIGGVILWMLKSRQSRYVPVRASGQQRSRGPRQVSQAKQAKQGKRFCPKCGEPAGDSDKFCPSCGSKLRDSA